MTLPDIQQTKPKIKIPIAQVGVENIQVPFLLELKNGGMKQMVANVSLRTNLDADTKGISMSRLILTLKKYIEVPLKQVLIYEILKDLAKEIGSRESYMKFDFLLPVVRKSVLTDNEFPIYHKCLFEGQMTTTQTGVQDEKVSQYSFRFFQGIIAQYTSYCPCSATLSKDLMSKGSMGFPHAQRSFAHILIQGDPNHYIWLEDILEMVESTITTLPYPIIKRIDEQEIARIAAENPIFVEDAIRAISEGLDEMEGVIDWHVFCRHEESIHTSEAIAVNWKGVPGGFDYRYYL